MSSRQINTWEARRKAEAVCTSGSEHGQPDGQWHETADCYAGVIAWLETEINDWIAARIAERGEG